MIIFVAYFWICKNMQELTIVENEGNMNMIFEHFGFNPDLLNNKIKEHGAIVAGSSSLFSYISDDINIISENVGDIDIWIPINNVEIADIFADMKDFFFKYDYLFNNTDIIAGNIVTQAYSGRFSEIIVNIKNFTNKELNKKIQLIFCKTNHEKILTTFDLTFCAVAFNGEKFLVIEPELTKKKIGYRMNNFSEYSEISERGRIIKYLRRSFTIFENSEDARFFVKYYLANPDIKFKMTYFLGQLFLESKFYENAVGSLLIHFAGYGVNIFEDKIFPTNKKIIIFKNGQKEKILLIDDDNIIIRIH